MNLTLEFLYIPLGIISNILSSVGIVLLNKYLWSNFNFKFMMFLSCIHFLFTTICCNVLLYYNFFSFKKLNSIFSVIPVSIGTLGSVAFMNLNLAYNSVGFYQISKLACIPATIILQYFLFTTLPSLNIIISLFIILIGVGVATVTDVQLNQTGSIFAIIAIVLTALGQIYTNSKQSDLQLNAMQLLYYTAPLNSIGLAFMIPIFDQINGSGGLLEYNFDATIIVLIFLTCLLAFGVNFSNYYVIGRTSPVTYQVTGHLKTCLILVLGFVVFKYPLMIKNLVGIFLAVIGMIFYSELKKRDSTTPIQQGYKQVPLTTIQGSSFEKDKDDFAKKTDSI